MTHRLVPVTASWACHVKGTFKLIRVCSVVCILTPLGLCIGYGHGCVYLAPMERKVAVQSTKTNRPDLPHTKSANTKLRAVEGGRDYRRATPTSQSSDRSSHVPLRFQIKCETLTELQSFNRERTVI
ncbi:hypothetical protein BDN67DRAFT_686654 [Paxillus ammoniavirescens]|nr:hypothetical protein BDN67DRAFT_686654 [Paxillus ammoniavirescens]